MNKKKDSPGPDTNPEAAAAAFADPDRNARQELPPMDAEEAERIFNLTPDMLCVAGLDGYFKRLNKAWEETLGYTHEELLSKPIFDFIHPDDRDSTMEEIKKQVTGEPTIYFENRYICKDGSYRLLAWRATTAFGENLYAAARDITEKRQADEAFDAILKATMGSVGQELLDNITGNLCEWLGADCVILGELGEDRRVRSRAMIMDGKRVEGFEYDLKATPCEDASKKGFCYFPERIAELYPEDRILVDFGAEGYAGSPVKNKKGKTIGILCAIFRSTLDLPPRVRDVFEVLAGRAAVELERLRFEDELSLKLHEIERLNHLMVGRELRIEELKREIAVLKEKCSRLKNKGNGG